MKGLFIKNSSAGFKERLITVFISPWFLALPVAIVIIYFLPEIERFKAEIVRNSITDKVNCNEVYYDLNADGISEKIILFNSQKNEAAVKIVDHDGGIIGWYDFKGLIGNYPPVLSDVDHNGQPEIYFLSNHKDSLFLCILSVNGYPSFVSNCRFIALTAIKDKINDYSIGNFSFTDLQLDGHDEVVFSVLAGYSLQPRRLYAYDTKHDTVFMGPVMGCQTIFVPAQLDDDPYTEFIGSSSSTGNIPPDLKIPFSDSSSWLMALDHQLNFIFEPVEYKGHKSGLSTKPIKDGNEIKIFSLFEFASNVAINPKIAFYDTDGNLLSEKELSKPKGKEYFVIVDNRDNPSDEIIVRDGSGILYRADPSLNLHPIGKMSESSTCDYKSFDLDDDGSLENVLLGNDYGSIYITRNDFSYPIHLKIPFQRNKSQFSIQLNGSQPPLLFIQRGEKEFWIRYQSNLLWFAKFPIWLGIYLIVLGFIHIIRKFQRIQQRKAKDREDQLAGLQLEAVSTYLDPHFTFNTLNTITSLIYKEDKIKAHQVITRFTSLIRTTLMQSGKVVRTLSEELDFVRDYLEIQQFRFGNIFSWKISHEERVNLAQPVPKMLVQQYVENAIKHGLKNRGEGGLLEINLLQMDKDILITIRDNGVGRKSAMENNEPGTGKGLMTMQQIFDLFEKTNMIRITQTINDLTDESGNPTGTEVVLTIRKL